MTCVDEIGNEIGDEVVRHISDMLRENSTLQFLSVSGERVSFLSPTFSP